MFSCHIGLIWQLAYYMPDFMNATVRTWYAHIRKLMTVTWQRVPIITLQDVRDYLIKIGCKEVFGTSLQAEKSDAKQYRVISLLCNVSCDESLPQNLRILWITMPNDIAKVLSLKTVCNPSDSIYYAYCMSWNVCLTAMRSLISREIVSGGVVL